MKYTKKCMRFHMAFDPASVTGWLATETPYDVAETTVAHVFGAPSNLPAHIGTVMDITRLGEWIVLASASTFS
jgi:hypothetical protein